MRQVWALVVLVVCVACGVPPGRDDGRGDDVSQADAGGRSDAGTGCRSAAECGATQACSAGRCVARTNCTSSRTCPGQVCDAAKGYCVDCAADADCPSGQRCSANLCQPPPPSCRSSRECSASGQVCDTQAGFCVDCVADTDCASGQLCGSDHLCLAQVCQPSSTVCADGTRLRTCDARGGGFSERSCGQNETCADGACHVRACQPNTVTCQSATARLVCDATGLHPTTQQCPANQVCSNGSCSNRLCQPGTVECTSSNTLRTCNVDGTGWDTTTCASSANATGLCANNACTVACSGGTRQCNGACVSDLASESCNGIDDDCDGQIDEGCTQGSCSSPFLVAPAGGVISGTMLGYSTVTGSCGYSGGVDRVFKWVPAKSGTATVNLSGDYYPVSLYVKTASCNGSEIACKSSQQWTSPTVTPTVSAGTAYYIVVDAQWASNVPPPAPYTTPHYTLTVTPAP